MVDAISVIGPGWRATDTSGNLITDGILSFFDAGTSNARTVYSDSALSSSLGTTVDCNSAGYPVTSGNARTLIYTGSTAYKVELSSAIVGGVIWSHDNVKGALDTSSFLTDAAVADQSVVATSSNRSVTTADKGKLINVNCSGGDVTITLADAATLGDGFFVGIRHDGTANQVIITGDGTDTFGISGVNTIRFALTGRGHAMWITCDATNFKCHSESPPLIGGTVGTVVIADRLSTPPGSPQAGARYIVGSSPTGAWSGFSEHDIAEADGAGNWFNYTPGTDAGHMAYVQDEDKYYSFAGSAWAGLGTIVSGMQSLQVFTSSGTWTKPEGISKILVIGTAGGGGGGDENSSGTGKGGGGAGGTCIEFIDVSGTSSETVTIGSGGAGGTGGGNGSSGGNTTFGSFFTASGGSAGSSSEGGAGGTATGGDMNISGGDGFSADTGSGGTGGNGGASFWGGGGRGPAGGSGSNGPAFGSGGGGGYGSGSTSGGDGGDGVVFVMEFGN